MQVITPEFVSGKTVLVRLDMDVVLKEWTMDNGQWTIEVGEGFRLEAGVPTLEMCLTHAKSVVVMGHLGRPNGKSVESLSVKPVAQWLKKKFTQNNHFNAKLSILENLRFDSRESFDPSTSLRTQDHEKALEFAKELATLGDFFVNESFAAYRPAVSTTILPKFLPHAAGLRFAKEVEVLTKVRENPSKPLVVIMGGAKVEDKLPVISEMAKIADAVLVGGKLPLEIHARGPVSSQPHSMSSLVSLAAGSQWGAPLAATPRVLSSNVLVGKLNENGTDIAQETVDSWKSLIGQAKMIVWNGPLGLVEELVNDKSRKVAELIIASGAESIIGGGDTVAYLSQYNLLDKFSFVSTGGGAMLEFLATGTLPTIQALE